MEDVITAFLKNASLDDYLALRNKIFELKSVAFNDFVLAIDRIIDIYQQ